MELKIFNKQGQSMKAIARVSGAARNTHLVLGSAARRVRCQKTPLIGSSQKTGNKARSAGGNGRSGLNLQRDRSTDGVCGSFLKTRVIEKRKRDRRRARRIKLLAFSQTYLETVFSNQYRINGF